MAAATDLGKGTPSYTFAPATGAVKHFRSPEDVIDSLDSDLESTVAVVARPELPKLGVGLFAGGAAVEGTGGGDTKNSSDIGLLGRYRLTQGLLIEAEIGKTSYEENLRNDSVSIGPAETVLTRTPDGPSSMAR